MLLKPLLQLFDALGVGVVAVGEDGVVAATGHRRGEPDRVGVEQPDVGPTVLDRLVERTAALRRPLRRGVQPRGAPQPAGAQRRDGQRQGKRARPMAEAGWRQVEKILKRPG